MTGKLIVSEGGRDRVHELHDEVTVIGRGVDSDLLLKDATASEMHCEVRRSARGFKVVDLESRGGTQVNGRFVNQHLLTNGDTIRIGETRLTFLGESAQPPPVPRAVAAAPALPESLPEGEDGRPRRYYRHESRRGAGSQGTTIAVLGVLGLLLAIAVWAFSKDPSPSEIDNLRAAQARAKAAFESRNEGALQAAIRDIEAIPRGKVRDTVQEEALLAARADLSRLQREKEDAAATEDFQNVTERWGKGDKDLAWLQYQVRRFKREHEASVHILTLEKMLKEATFGSPEDIAAWDATLVKLATAQREGRFKEAFAILEGLEADPKLATLNADHLAVSRGALESAFKRHFEKRTGEAVELHTEGRSDRARAILREIIELGREPYAEQAQQLLNRLR